MRKYRSQITTPAAAARPPAPTLNTLFHLLEKSGIILNDEQLYQLWRYHNLLRNRNQDRDLTRLVGFESIVLKHYVDSIIVGKYMTLPTPLLDVGTGAGFPGIPLKIRYPHLKMILAEPRPSRILFLKEAINELKLKHVEVFEHKVVSQSFARPVQGVITRAIEEIDKTILRTSASLVRGGLWIFMKGPNVDPELESALSRFVKSIKLVLDKRYVLPHTPHERRLVVFERQDEGTMRSKHE